MHTDQQGGHGFFEFIPLPRRDIIRMPDIALARKQTAKAWRYLRNTDRQLARLAYQRMVKGFKDTGHVHLADLLDQGTSPDQLEMQI